MLDISGVVFSLGESALENQTKKWHSKIQKVRCRPKIEEFKPGVASEFEKSTIEKNSIFSSLVQ